jgi:hypothetical protein
VHPAEHSDQRRRRRLAAPQEYPDGNFFDGKRMLDKLWAFGPSQLIVGQFLQSFRDYPPPAKAGVGGIEQALEMIQNAANAAGK